jgi:hypothetical protein
MEMTPHVLRYVICEYLYDAFEGVALGPWLWGTIKEI